MLTKDQLLISLGAGWFEEVYKELVRYGQITLTDDYVDDEMVMRYRTVNYYNLNFSIDMCNGEILDIHVMGF